MTVVEAREPARPERAIGTFELLSASKVSERIGAAAAASREWVADAPARAATLQAWADRLSAREAEFVDLLTREIGKPVRESRAELRRATAIVRYYAQAAFDPVAELMPTAEADAELRVHRRPRGVVLVICPWNFPLAIASWKLAPALAYGNVVLFKPSSSALATSTLLVEAAQEVFPSGVLQLVPAAPEAVDRAIDDPRVDAVTFTGSVAVGRSVIARGCARGIPVQAELGGQNPSIVLDDADLPFAANTIARAAMEFAGQKCTATRRVIVAESVAPRFVPLLVDAIRGLNVGMPEREDVEVGPVISESARGSIEVAVSEARARGARVLYAGERRRGAGWFVDPTLLELDDPSDAFVQEETFGPAAAVLLAKSDEAAIGLANGTRFGLTGAVFGTDLERARRVALSLDAGLQRVNAPTTGVDFHAPFGGDKQSGYGPREQGRAAREFFTTTRTLLVCSRH